jgi:putative membrane protein
VKALFDEKAKAQAKEAVQHLEKTSSVEFVIVVEPRASNYREADHLWGGIASIVLITLLIFSPQELDERVWPIYAALGYGIGFAGSTSFAFVKRLFLKKARFDSEVSRHARARFVDGRLSRTRDRSALLLHISAFERTVAFVLDLGLDEKKLGPALASLKVSLEKELVRGDLPAFMTQLKTLAPALEAAYPRREDDTNELPDDVS